MKYEAESLVPQVGVGAKDSFGAFNVIKFNIRTFTTVNVQTMLRIKQYSQILLGKNVKVTQKLTGDLAKFSESIQCFPEGIESKKLRVMVEWKRRDNEYFL